MTYNSSITRRALIASLAAANAGELFAAPRLRHVYVSSSQGSDWAAGDHPQRPLRTFARASESLAEGAALALRRGDVWDEMLEIHHDRISVGAYGGGPPPLIDGAGKRHGILIRGADASVNDIEVRNAVNGVYVSGQWASARVQKCLLWACGSGLVAGYGGWLIEAKDIECHSCKLSLGAADGIQISEDAAEKTTIIIFVRSHGNEKSGINIKIGSTFILNSEFFNNGECGVLAQIHAVELIMSNSRLFKNNVGDNGTFNIALEDHVRMISRANLYANPFIGTKSCNNVNLSGATRFVSILDEFIEEDNSENMGASIRLDARAEEMFLCIVHGSIFKTSRGWAIDAYGSMSKVHIELHNTVIDASNGGGIRVANMFARPIISRTLVNMSERRRLVASSGAGLIFNDENEFDFVLDDEPIFVRDKIPLLELILRPSSHGVATGRAVIDVRQDRNGIDFGPTPNIGARA